MIPILYAQNIFKKIQHCSNFVEISMTKVKDQFSNDKNQFSLEVVKILKSINVHSLFQIEGVTHIINERTFHKYLYISKLNQRKIHGYI